MRDLVHLHPYQGDRLEPTESLRDVADFSTAQPPFRALFWRSNDGSRVLHRSPLFFIPGITTLTHGTDSLHIWALGPVPAFIAFVLWWLVSILGLFAADVVGLAPEDNVRLALMAIKRRLWAHYKLSRKTDPRWRRKGAEIWNNIENTRHSKGSFLEC